MQIMATLKFKTAATLLATSLLMLACDSGGGSSTLEPQAPTTDADNLNPNDGLPDFAVIDYTTSDYIHSEFTALATVSNAGTAGELAPDAWVLVSQENGFANNYQEIPVTLIPADNIPGKMIEPGETRQFRVVRLLDAIQITFDDEGTHYTKLWINPDLGVRFKNPEAKLMESHAVLESDYLNNISSEKVLKTAQPVSSRIDCTPDQYEENDSIDEATPIVLDTVYEFSGCDDVTDVMTIDLVAGETYELRKTSSDNSLWDLTVIDPDDTYRVRRSFSDSELFTAHIGGPYTIVTAYQTLNMSAYVSLEVVQR